MKRIITMIFAFAIGYILMYPVGEVTNTQTPATPATPIEMIMEGSDGNINIDIPESILNSINQAPASTAPAKKGGTVKRPGTANLKTGVNNLTGYRVQVFSDGQNQATLESRARARGNLILSKFPKYRGQVYTFSSSPNWYCRVGNFRTSEDAQRALSELKSAFPNLAAEMRVVKSAIVVIK